MSRKPRAYEILEEEHFRRFRQQFNIRLDGEVVTNMGGIIEEANLAAANLLGSPRAFLLGKPLPFFAVRESRPAFYKRLVQLATQPDYFPGWVDRLKPVRGEPFDAAVYVSLVFNAAGQPMQLRWALHDLTAVDEAAEFLRSEQAFIDCLLEVPQVLILVVDGFGRIIRYNPYLESLTGFERPHMDGKDWRLVLVPPAERSAARELIELALSRGQAGPRLHALVTGQDERRAVSWTSRSFRRSANKGEAVLLVGHDVTELLEAQQQALRVERLAAIGEMVAALAHESRNALQSATACLERLRWRLQERPEELELINRMEKAQDELLRLYEDVRNYASPVQLEMVPQDLRKIWETAWEQVTPTRQGRDALLEGTVEGTECSWPVDAFRMIQVFRNLFQNALDACSDPVRIRVVCHHKDSAAESFLRITVRDNGPGFAPEQRGRLFEPFYTTKARGSGLGLAIVRRLIEAQGGQIVAGECSPPGAEFILTFSRRQP